MNTSDNISITRRTGNSPVRIFLLLTLALLLSGCAGQKARLSDPDIDPWEPYNRKMHGLTRALTVSFSDQ